MVGSELMMAGKGVASLARCQTDDCICAYAAGDVME